MPNIAQVANSLRLVTSWPSRKSNTILLKGHSSKMTPNHILLSSQVSQCLAQLSSEKFPPAVDGTKRDTHNGRVYRE